MARALIAEYVREFCINRFGLWPVTVETPKKLFFIGEDDLDTRYIGLSRIGIDDLG